MSNKIYNVKQAAKILGLSTNTTYKYLNEGRIKAARGDIRGTFIIPAKSLETFLGSKLPDDTLIESELSNHDEASFKDSAIVIDTSSPTLATKVTRILITISLLIIIADIVLTQNFSPIAQLARITLIAILLLISYQFGGFIKR
ncbi:MAG: hypothetical protein UW68_C0027G0008 [Candidatus Collierbacteria bacterium GW2011_GWB1_44_6]|uniref:Helix-turn-helix domain-containing protein n=1 Tax=Candidatus Collierbacteria bacterium GW2011_GWB1_44_6 TaxID=1618384 RepID=A0A0G1LVA5_9BACT|nr:MAG: hypothetical protein UW68_C0027G0008 [Candidatus Collierbacteria bacterium GW2011_GWB1_44_6]